MLPNSRWVPIRHHFELCARLCYPLLVLSRLGSGCLITLFLLSGSWRPAVARPAPASSRPYLVVIVMDGFRADYATLAPMRHLRDLMKRGMFYDTAWVGQMESETPPGHATIATGVYPKKHGVVGFGWRDAASGAFTYMPTDLRQIGAGNLERTIAQGGVPTISDLIHTRDKHDLVVAVSAEKYYAAAAMGAGADYILFGKETNPTFRPFPATSNVPPASTHFRSITEHDGTFDNQDDFASRLAVQLVKTLRPRALLLNLPATDIAGHFYGGMLAPRDMTSIIKSADWAIGRVEDEYRKLGLLNRTVFVVTADHGMAGNRHIVPIHPMYDAVKKITSDQILDEEFRISVGTVWLRQQTLAPPIAAALAAKHFRGVEGALYKVGTGTGAQFAADPATAAALPKSLLHAYLDLANTEAGPTGPDVVLPYVEDGTGLIVKGSKHWGSHGGFSWGVQHIPLVIAGPGVRHGVSHFPAKLVDVAPTIEQLIGVPIPTGVDGVVLSDALTTSTPDQKSAQRAVQGPRLSDLVPIRSHSAAQSRKR
jgi:arylsulfatase A-like enzyme